MLELEAEREQRQRDYDKKLLLAKSKIENVQVRMQEHKSPGYIWLLNMDTENYLKKKKKIIIKNILEKIYVFMFQGEKECLNSETTELKQKIRYLQDQLLPLSKQREYQEKEIQRLNRVSEEQMRGLIP